MLNIDRTIISQYANSPTIRQIIADFNANVDPRADFETLYDYVWNVDTAQGFGLDIWGRIVGVGRIINVPADTPNPGGFPFTPGAYALPDDDYRRLIMVKALANIAGCAAPTLSSLLNRLFEDRGRCYILDTGSMTMQLTCEFYLEPFEYVILTSLELMPRPGGVLLNVIQIDPAQTFGFYEGVQFQPFDQGAFLGS